MTASQLENRVAQLRDLPAIPHVVMELCRIAEDPQATAQQYEECISREPALTVKVIRTANSAIFCPPGGVVRTLRQAIALIGNRTLRGIALAFGVHDGYDARRTNSAINLDALWTHSLATATGSRVLAVLTQSADPTESFLAGLVHDLGILVMDVADPESIGRALSLAERKGMSLSSAETKLGTPTHAEWGMAAARRWSLPDTLVNAAGYHHSPWKDKETGKSTEIVHAACCLASGCGMGVVQNMPAPGIAWEVKESIGFPDAQLDEIVKVMIKETRVAKESFGMAA